MNIRKLIALLLATCFVLSSASAADLKIATMRLGSSWYVFGATLYQLLKSELPGGTRVEVLAKGGGIGNPITVNSGKAALGITNVATGQWAYEGHPEIYRGRAQKNIRALVGGLTPVSLTAVVRKDFLKKSGFSTLEDILTKRSRVRIVMKPRGSTVPVVADILFEALGTDRKKIQANGGRIIQVDSKQVPAIMRDGRADLYLEVAPIGHPTTTEVCLTGDVTFLPVAEKTVAKMATKGLIPSSLPQVYQGQSGPIRSVDLGTMLIANASLSEDLAYLVTKTICENASTMARAHKAWEAFDPTQAGRSELTGIPLHPGAARYYRERGWLAQP